MSDCPTRARLQPRAPAPPLQLGGLAAAIAGALPPPAGPRPEARPARLPAARHPFVLAVLAAFPGAEIVAERERDPGAT